MPLWLLLCVASAGCGVFDENAAVPAAAENFLMRPNLCVWLMLCVAPAGCGMFDESAAVPAADEYDDFPNEAQPLGPYSCSISEAGGSGPCRGQRPCDMKVSGSSQGSGASVARGVCSRA